MSEMPVAWSVLAQNLPEHAHNAIHTDAGARAAGFESALVAGVTTYAYLTHPLVAAWGIAWLTHGGGEVRFRAPVFAGRTIDCVPTVPTGPTDGTTPDVVVDAIDGLEGPVPRVVFRAVRHAGPVPDMRPGEVLPDRQFTLDDRYGLDYGERAGDDLDIYRHCELVHPAVWPAIANNIMSTDLVTGSWIHTRSIIRHHAPGPAGAVVDVHATVVDRFDRGGHRAVIDVSIEHEGRTLATLEHEAIVELA